jgi:hypothetical protein
MRRFLIFLMLFFCCRAAAQDVALFNKDGKAIAYIDTKDKDRTIYLYSGEPVAIISEADIYMALTGSTWAGLKRVLYRIIMARG